MPTIFSHAAVPMFAALIATEKWIPRPLAMLGMAVAILPDADVLAFKFGIAYTDQFGHRGASHSLAFAALLGLLCCCAAYWKQVQRPWLWGGFIALAAASHGLLDMATNGGEGVALLWPALHERLFWPVTPIEVSPIGRGFLSWRGVQTLYSEFLWIWLPMLALWGGAHLLRRRQAG
ncbi:metal-dependent hydrolase [Massilia sp. W12]|uniref:metal-dependent hydrolase n=1 Tax=Massilia sp. W12 TaxID=3126507 RepID=UPI0030CF4520